jgi:predicted negative regulator of RcsB-dependent stress response
MPKHPTSSRVPKLEPQPDDKFVLAVERISYWARQNTRLLIFGGVAVVLVVLGTIYYVDSQRRVEAEAAVRLGEVHQTIMTGNAPLAIRDLQAYLATFGGTRAAREARLLLADLLMGQDRPDEAIQALGRLHRDLDEPVGIAAAQVLAAAYEQLEQYDQAIDTYRRIARDARFEFQRRDALANAGRVALDTGQPALAAEFYDRVVQTFEEGNPERSYYEMWRAEANAMAGRTTPAATPAPPSGDTDEAEEEPAEAS